jgi:hypothetical protein
MHGYFMKRGSLSCRKYKHLNQRADVNKWQSVRVEHDTEEKIDLQSFWTCLWANKKQTGQAWIGETRYHF